jgi:hypothetical protein
LLEHATEVLELTLRSLCASPGRLRRKLRHLIDHWAGLHNVAEELDTSAVMAEFIGSRGGRCVREHTGLTPHLSGDGLNASEGYWYVE